MSARFGAAARAAFHFISHTPFAFHVKRDDMKRIRHILPS